MSSNKGEKRARGWAARIGRLALWLGVAALLLPAIGLTLARYDVIAKMPGFQTLLYGGMLALAALAMGLLALLLSFWQGGAGRKPAVLGCLLAAPLLLFLANGYQKAQAVPRIHDITTDLADPPQFKAITLRADNLAGVETEANWRKIHAEAYPDIKPLRLAKPVADVMQDVRAIAEGEGWEIVDYAPNDGRLEAVAFVSYIRFHDDVAVRVRPNAEGDGSIVDMRSVSEVGVSDLGVNAARIRSFMAALKAKSGHAGAGAGHDDGARTITPSAPPIMHEE